MDTAANTDTSTAEALRTFEVTDGSVSYVYLTRTAPGAVGTAVRRQKRRGRPQYQRVEGVLVPASAKPSNEELPKIAANLLLDAAA